MSKAKHIPVLNYDKEICHDCILKNIKDKQPLRDNLLNKRFDEDWENGVLYCRGRKPMLLNQILRKSCRHRKQQLERVCRKDN